MSDESPLGLLQLPKGGGAQHGLGDAFSADLFTGGGRYEVPLELPPGRAGLAPRLSLAYATTRGNGPFGLGWDVAVPSLARKASKGLPRYDDSDAFELAGADDLVRLPDQPSDARVALYRPRTVTDFARIERHREPWGEFWVVRTRDGLVHTYGSPRPEGAPADWHETAVVADPDDPSRRFAWKLSETRDTYGNRIEYAYERRPMREGARRWEETLLDEVRYVDVGPRFAVVVRFAYEARPDPFSSHRAGFEVRTTTRCARVEVWSHAAGDELLRTYALTYTEAHDGASLLARVEVSAARAGGPVERLPPLDFGYTALRPETRRLVAVPAPEPPAALGDPSCALVDLTGDGLPDVLQLLPGQARWWRNLGPRGLARPRPMREAPLDVALGDPAVRMIDADGDGRAELVIAGPGLTGYFSTDGAGGWSARSFQRWEQAPSFAWSDPAVRLVDLDGDGVTDAIRSGEAFECWFNDPTRGWSAATRVERRDASVFPDVDFADPHVQWADMTGDGLSDVVVVHDGHVAYWPSLGRGRFGPRVDMRAAPRLPAGYDPRRVLVGDVDGDGLADLVFIDAGRVTVWINRGGNDWSDPIAIPGTPAVTDLDAVQLVDWLGTGVAGILWSLTAGDGTPRLVFLALTDAKPNLLERIDNHVGGVTTLAYAPSTQFHLDDLEAGAPWRTSLPFPVQVLRSITTDDAVTGAQTVREFRYHHGSWDGAEREFRGFGRVDERDTRAGSATPPLETRTWFHLGPVGDAVQWAELDLSDEYWAGDPPYLPRSRETEETLGALATAERRHAFRALRGRVLRTELFARDGTAREGMPYTTTEHVYDLATLGDGTFSVHQSAERTTQWDRGADPMTSLAFTDALDTYGQPQLELHLALARGRDLRAPAPGAERATLASITVTRRGAMDTPDAYLVDRVTSRTEHELRDDGLTPLDTWARVLTWWAHPATPLGLTLLGQTLHTYDGPELVGLPLGAIGAHGALKRVETLTLTEEILTAALGAVPAYLVPGATAWPDEYPAAFRAQLPALAGYRFEPGDGLRACGYLATTTAQAHDARGCVVTRADALGARTEITYDAPGLLITSITDPAQLVTTVTPDYRTFTPAAVRDPNGNETRYAFSPLGLLQSVARVGKPELGEGDRDRPGTTYSYDLLAFQERGEPISTATRHFTHHPADPDDRGEQLETREYSDGFGHLYQTRTLAEDDRFGDSFGGSVLPALATGPVVGRPRDPAALPNVVVSGWQKLDDKGRVVERYEPFFSTGWAPRAEEASRRHKATFAYDARGRLVRQVNADGSEIQTVFGVPRDLAKPDEFEPTPWETTTYDANDNAGRTPGADAGAAAYAEHWDTPTSVVVDALGRAVEHVSRLSASEAQRNRTEVDLRGNVLAMWDEAGRPALRHRYDLAGRPLRAEQLDRKAPTRAVFDARGGVVETRGPVGSLRLEARDALGRRTHLWARDRVGEAVTLRERTLYGDGADAGLDRPAARALNALGRMVARYDEAGLARCAGYDLAGNARELGRRAIDDAVLAAACAPGPDGAWRVAVPRVDWGAAPLADLAAHLDATEHRTTHTFDAVGRLTRVTCPTAANGARKRIERGYNRAGLLERVTVDGQVILHHAAYDAGGRRTFAALGDPASEGSVTLTRWDHDEATGRLRRLRIERAHAPAPLRFEPVGPPLQDLAYTYDLVGNVRATRNTTPGCGVVGAPDALERAFAYDPLYRLAKATGRECAAPLDTPWSPAPRCTDLTKARLYEESYAYDVAGNLSLLRRAPSGAPAFQRVFALEDGTNRLRRVQIGATAYAYEHDDGGNLIRENLERRFGWDHAGRLVSFRIQGSDAGEPSVWVAYLHDADGKRVKKLVRKQGGRLASTVYIDGVFEHDREDEGGAARTQSTIHVGDDRHRLATIRAVAPGAPPPATPPVQLVFADHLGSSVLTTSADGSWIAREEYTPFGETSFGGHARKRYRFTGRERDEESGLYFHDARSYAPWLCRWTSPDPAGPVDGLNLYAYTRNNPLRFVDPTGTNAEPAGGGSFVEAWNRTQEAFRRQPTLEARGTREEVAQHFTTPVIGRLPDGSTFQGTERNYAVAQDHQRMLRGTEATRAFEWMHDILGGAGHALSGRLDSPAHAPGPRPSRGAPTEQVYYRWQGTSTPPPQAHIHGNKRAGWLNENLQIERFAAAGHVILGTQVVAFKASGRGKRSIDAVVITPDGTLRALEFKLGASRYKSDQRAFDTQMETQGARVRLFEGMEIHLKMPTELARTPR